MWGRYSLIDFPLWPTVSFNLLKVYAGTACFAFPAEAPTRTIEVTWHEQLCPPPINLSLTAAADQPAKPEKQKETTPEFIASIAVVLVTGLFIITFVLQAFEIPSSSMENTLLIGDHCS